MIDQHGSCSRGVARSAMALSLLLVTGAFGQNADPEKVAAVQRGELPSARASWWGWDPHDSTQSFQAALNSRARQIVVDNIDRPWIVTTIRLPSDKEIVFEPGVIVEAKRGAFLGTNDCLFTARGVKNLTIRGNGATLRMHKEDYHRPPYKPAEWRHALSLRGCENVSIDRLTLANSGGDGIYLGVGSGGAPNRRITIRNVICDGNNRQGVSVITAEDLLLENCVFRNTRGTAPQAGIDFEPNRPDERLVRCVLRNCVSESNAGHAYHLYLGNLHRESTPVSIRFENCISRICERYSTHVGVANREGKRSVRGTIEYVNCRFESDRNGAVYIRGNEADGCLVRLRQCEIVRPKNDAARFPPIMIEAPRQLGLAAGNIVLDDCVIEDSTDRRPIGLAASPLTPLSKITGSLTYKSPAGTYVFTLDDSLLNEWFPDQGRIAAITPFDFDWQDASPQQQRHRDQSVVSSWLRLRRSATMMAWAEAGDCVLDVKFEGVSRTAPSPAPITVTGPNGKSQNVAPASTNGLWRFRWTAGVTGTHRITWQSDSHQTIRPVHWSMPLAMLAPGSGLSVFRSSGTLHFPVPRGIERFAIVVTGAGGAETVKATVRNGDGVVQGEEDNITAPHVFLLERSDSATDAVWSVSLEKASEGVLEDVTVQAVGIPPVFALSPEDAFFPQ